MQAAMDCAHWSLAMGPLPCCATSAEFNPSSLRGWGRGVGFAGGFAIKNAEVSSAMLAEKTQAVFNTQAEVCTACDNSCLMHIEGALHRQRTGVKTLHLAEILAGEESAQ